MISFLFFSLCMGLSSGIGVIVSNCFGAKKRIHTAMVSVSCALLQAMINGYGVNVMATRLEQLLRQFIDHCSVLPILFSLCFLSCVGGLTHGIPFLLYIRYPPSFLFELLDNLSKSCFLVLCP